MEKELLNLLEKAILDIRMKSSNMTSKEGKNINELADLCHNIPAFLRGDLEKDLIIDSFKELKEKLN